MSRSAATQVKVLLVDDEPANLLALHAVIGNLNVVTIEAYSGAEALRRLREDEFAVVLLDVKMSGMDGFETAHAIRGRQETRHTPIVFLTAYDTDRAAIEKAYALGAVDLLVKPIMPVVLHAKVSGFVELFQYRKQIEVQAERLRQTERRDFERKLRLAHQIAKIGHWEWNSLTDENLWSPEIEALYGLPPGGFAGGYDGWVKLLHPDDVARAEGDVRRALETGDYFSEFRVVWPDGSVHWLETRAVVLKDGHDRPVRIVGVNMEITDRKKQELQLREADRRKDEFLATLAHELRNPLAPVRYAVELLRGSGDDKLKDRALGIIGRQIDQMVRLVDDLFDMNRISQGKVRLRPERVELNAVLQSALELVEPQIQSQAHDLTVTLAPEPTYLDADATRLAQVVSNLLNNAAKYTEKGGRIWLTAERQGQEAVVSVRDTGIGIAAEHLPRLFQMFAQATPALERSQGGLGIGLSLVRGLVELHGGRVEARSAGLGCGSEFIVHLPVAAEPMPQSPETGSCEPVASPRSLKILAVDDNRDAADSLALMLRMLGHETRTAYDGEEALQIAAEYRPDAVVLDIGLPKLNGYEVARRLRQEPWGASLTLIALTGWGQDEDKRRAQEAGFDQHLTKPVDAAALEKLFH